ncbi:hypothetical protein M5X17_27640 [Paenibacillus alvei]|uniref:hypothetical protein n=1 Tax=Paenibacillus alvei TaxID=44250 RepID=UPI00227E50AE|nr:hypothetical protein [Paenibacillus alvei]MCY9737479.1 hypothetical protein [Paenibacillus alvei]
MVKEEEFLIALDLSLACTGVTVFSLTTLKPVYIKSIVTKPKQSHGKQLYFIASELKKIKSTYNIKALAIERGFNRYPTATAALYKVHGVALCVFHELKEKYYPPKTVKLAILTGSSSKIAIRNRIELEYPDVVFANEDESDSFAVGLTYLIKEKNMKWVKSSRGKARKATKKQTVTTIKKPKKTRDVVI